MIIMKIAMAIVMAELAIFLIENPLVLLDLKWLSSNKDNSITIIIKFKKP